jgi:hypothetical protein
MTELVVVECRNKTAAVLNPNTSNGDWQTNLQEHIVIEEGDEIVARNVFIDTKAATSPQEKIVVPRSVRLTMSYFLYNINWQGAVTENGNDDTNLASSSIIPFNNTSGLYVAKNDGEAYVACERIPAPAGAAKFGFLKEFDFVVVYVSEDGGGFDVVFFFDGLNGTSTYKVISLYGADPDYGNKSYSVVADIPFQTNGSPTFPPGSPNAGQQQDTPIACYVAKPDGTPDWNIRLDGNRNYPAGKRHSFYKNTRIPPLADVTPFTKESVIPKLFTTSIDIEGGAEVAYDPTELAETINRKFTEIQKDTITESELTGNNQFLQHVGKGQPAANAAFNNFVPLRSENTQANEYAFVYNTGTTGNEGARWVGSSQVELAFNPTTRKFSFNFLHTPIYAGGAINVGVVRANQAPNDGDGNPVFKTFPITKNGGLLISSLSSKYIDTNEVASFWERELGFGLSTPGSKHLSLNYLYSNPDMVSDTDSGTSHSLNAEPLAIPIFKSGIAEGIKTTGGFLGLDSMVQKGASGSANPFYEVPVLPTSTGANEIFSTSDAQTEIEAINSVLNSKNSITFGYFLAEVKAQFKGGDLISENANKHNVMAIVSRYYQQDSYTSSSSDAAVIYQHNSPEPVLLNSLKCRILDSDGNLADNIGQDNTIFIEIVKKVSGAPLNRAK